MQARDEKKEETWTKQMFPIAIEIAEWHASNRADAQDMAQTALMHLILVNRRQPELELAENEGYARRVLQNSIRDWRRLESRRTIRLQQLSEEAIEDDDRRGEHTLHKTTEAVFEDERMTDFIDPEWLIRVYHVLRSRLAKKPRRLLDAIFELNTFDPEVLAQATGIQSADSVRATHSAIRRTAKKLNLLDFSE